MNDVVSKKESAFVLGLHEVVTAMSRDHPRGLSEERLSALRHARAQELIFEDEVEGANDNPVIEASVRLYRLASADANYGKVRVIMMVRHFELMAWEHYSEKAAPKEGVAVVHEQ